MPVIADKLDALPHSKNFQKNLGILIEKLLVVDVNKGEVVVCEKFLLDEEVPDGALSGIGAMVDEPQSVADVTLVNVDDVFTQKFAHTFLIKLLESVE